jgi:amino acid adenylation domain-containing protein/thioester reductase-like protein
MALTYADLHRRAQGLAATLVQQGAGRETVVGLGVERSADYLVALLATWYAGAAFLPLDPALPRDRLAFMVGDSGCRLAVVQPGGERLLDGLELRFVHPDVNGGDFKRASVRDDDLAYVIYSSGSTGIAKGVLVEQRGIVHLLRAQIEAFSLTPSSRTLFYLSTSFDASVSDIGTAFLAGAALHLEPAATLQDVPSLPGLLERRGITCVDLPPALLRVLDPTAMPACLKTVVIGGEVCPVEVVRRWARRVRLVNVYGPTEATVCSSMGVCDADTWDAPLLGQPLPGVTYRVVDGELYIGGVGLARGYLTRPELTACKFVVLAGERFYRSGDHVWLRPDGEYVFLGRLDRQVKVRGQLVEPDEIEGRLLQHPDVLDAAVVQRPVGAGREGLVAFVVPRRHATGVRWLRDWLGCALPPWMVPQSFQTRDALPRTSSGKVDLMALTSCELSESSGEQAELSTPEARLLAEVWREVLGIGAVRPEDCFLDQGGDSLAALEAAAAAASRGILVPPGWLLEPLSLTEIADRIGEGGALALSRSCDELRDDVRLEGELHEWLHEATHRPEGRHNEPDPRCILLTGATGFLGARLLDELLQRSDAEVVCFVRATDAADGHKCVETALRRQDRPLKYPDRVRTVCGDLERSRLGLQESAWRQLSEQVDAIYHCAARVNMVLPYDSLRHANVGGTREVLRLLLQGRRKRLHHVSSLSVFVSTDCDQGRMEERDELPPARRVFGGYAQTKWAAEELIRSAGVGPRAIYRPGLITGDSRTGFGPSTDFLGSFVRGLARLGCVPREGLDTLKVDVTPVDFVAAALVHLSLTSAAENRTFHLANPRSLLLGELVEAMRSHGMVIEATPLAEWRRRAAVRREDRAIAAASLALCRCTGAATGVFAAQRTVDLFQATDATFVLDNAVSGLAGTGIVCPPPEPELLRKYLLAWDALEAGT